MYIILITIFGADARCEGVGVHTCAFKGPSSSPTVQAAAESGQEVQHSRLSRQHRQHHVEICRSQAQCMGDERYLPQQAKAGEAGLLQRQGARLQGLQVDARELSRLLLYMLRDQGN